MASARVLVASGEPLHAKAITLSSRKWGARGEAQLLRLSFGRFGEDLATTVSDDELQRTLRPDLETAKRQQQQIGYWLGQLPENRSLSAADPRLTGLASGQDCTIMSSGESG